MNAKLRVELRRAIQVSELSVKEIADKAGIRPLMLKWFVEGKRDMRPTTAIKVINAMGLRASNRRC